jgi:diguanylate cyclase (GGDEF)-like protein/PAS domain S-box-containing protein
MGDERGRVAVLGMSSKQWAAAVIESAGDAISVESPDGTILSWNPAAARLYQYQVGEIVGRNVEVLVPRYLAGEPARLSARLEAGGRVEDYETVRQRQDGTLIDVSITVSVIRDASGTVVAFSTIARDITDRKEYERLIEHRALHDSLTDLANRTVALDHLDLALQHVRRSGSLVAVLFIDLDNFKWINDTYGHVTGDQVLRVVAHRLRNAVRPEDTVARLGGDEFLVVCSDVATKRQAIRVAERVARMVAMPFDLDDATELVVRASIGVRVGRSDESAAAIIGDADTAMYRAKGSGRDTDTAIMLFDANTTRR